MKEKGRPRKTRPLLLHFNFVIALYCAVCVCVLGGMGHALEENSQERGRAPTVQIKMNKTTMVTVDATGCTVDCTARLINTYCFSPQGKKMPFSVPA